MSSRKGKVFTRDGKGLFDAMLSELEDLRDGFSTPQEAIAASELGKTANAVLNDDTTRLLKRSAFELACKEREARLLEHKTQTYEHDTGDSLIEHEGWPRD